MNSSSLPNVVVYGKESCPFCQKTKEKFKSSGLLYHDCTTNTDHLKYLQDKLNYEYVPMVFFKTDNDRNRYIFKGGWSDVKDLDV